MQVLKGKFSGLWSAKDVLYFLCPDCGGHVPWRKYPQSSLLVGSCCGLIFNASPLNEASRFQVNIGMADLTNVIVVSVIDDGAYGA